MQSFLSLLFKRGSGSDFSEKVNDFYQKLADDLRVLPAPARNSATELGDDTVDKIRAALSQRTGKKYYPGCAKQNPS